MPRLLLLRHAKAERSGRGGKHDHERPLADRGHAESKEMGKALAARGETVDLVLCSTSERTRETWKGMRHGLRQVPEVRFLPAIYEGEDYIEILRQEGGGAASVLLVGHNPAVQETAVRLAGYASSGEGALMAQHFPPAALAIFDFDGTWDRLAAGQTRLVAFIRPTAGAAD
jgi:phosphohistidine phosphatase